MNTQLVFRDVSFNSITRNNQIWLSSKEIANALGYAKTNAITKIYNQNSDEFTQAMSLVVESTTPAFEVPKSGTSGNLKVRSRIFSLRGAHLIAMFARTPVAKEFRKWVLDILDKEAGNTQTEATPVARETKSDHRYHVRVIIYDNLFGSCVEMLGKADTFKAIANGIATDLGYKPIGFISIPASKEKIKRIY